MEYGESSVETLKREVVEETGYSIKNIQFFDKIKAYVDIEKRGPLDITATFYIAEFDKKIIEPIEKNHKILWVDPIIYQEKLYTEYQRFILKKYVSLKKSF